ncbi:MAG TPA: formate--tetrahydrofolate ligase, partial [Firmicutes bacterium]|nr:formate--tetrahydrofolate ligase [Bacillota bacterium]
LAKHIDSIQQFNLPYVVAINQFTHDTEAELNYLKTWCEQNNHPCEIANVWLNGGAGAKDLANTVVSLIEANEKTFTHLYNREQSLEDKILTIA